MQSEAVMLDHVPWVEQIGKAVINDREKEKD